MLQTGRIDRDDWGKLILGLTIFLSTIVRLLPGWMAGFPLNDGGMFLVMLRELKAGQFLIPAFTAYNHSNIPFAYPPFGFYVGALFSAMGIPDMDILRWLPVIISLLTIPAFFLLAETLLEDRPRAAVATTFYALLPAYGWEIMGGGLTRSFGMLFMLLALHFAVRLFRSGSWKFLFPAGVFGALSVMSHPETAIHTAYGIAFFWFFTKPSWQKALQALALAILSALLSAPWWLMVYLQHGWEPFVSAAGTGVHDASPLYLFVAALFERQTFLPFLAIFRLAGILWEASQRRFALILWAALAYVLDQRSAGATSSLAFALLCAYGFADAIPFAIQWLKTRTQNVTDFVQLSWLNLTLFGVMFYLFVECGLYSFVLVNTSLRPPQPLEAMQWARTNTTVDSRFILLTGNPGIMSDPIQEWFPALAERRSLTTMQGLEWTLGTDFFPRLRSLIDLQACTTVDCVNLWSVDTGLSYDYLLIQKLDATRPLLDLIGQDGGYLLVYDNPSIVIFQKK